MKMAQLKGSKDLVLKTFRIVGRRRGREKVGKEKRRKRREGRRGERKRKKRKEEEGQRRGKRRKRREGRRRDGETENTGEEGVKKNPRYFF